jgi:hydrogenase maturation protease
MKRVVIGIGSPLGADQAGWRVVEQLQQLQQHHSIRDLDYLQLDRPGVALLQQMRGYQQVILVDAVLLGREEMEPVVLERSDLLQQSPSHFSTHATGIAETIAVGVVLDELPQQLSLVGVPLFSVDAEFSTEAIQKAVNAVLNLLGMM